MESAKVIKCAFGIESKTESIILTAGSVCGDVHIDRGDSRLYGYRPVGRNKFDVLHKYFIGAGSRRHIIVVVAAAGHDHSG